MFWLFINQLYAAPVQEAWPKLEFKKTIEKRDQDAALIVSIEDYALVSDVKGANRNGEDWYNYLSQQQGIPTKNIRWLQDDQASKEAILNKANEMRGITEAGGKLWFIFIGHGAPSKDGSDGVLVGMDASQSAMGLYERSIPQSELLSILENGKHKDTIAIIDACFSGNSDAGSLVPNLQPLIATSDIQTGDVYVLSAGTSEQFAGPLPGADRPAFSYLTLGGLTGWADQNQDGQIRTKEVVDFSNDALQSTLVGRQQSPQLLSPNTDVVLQDNITYESLDFASINTNVKLYERYKIDLKGYTTLFGRDVKKSNIRNISYSTGTILGLTTGYFLYQSAISSQEAYTLNLDECPAPCPLYDELQQDSLQKTIIGGIVGAVSVGTFVMGAAYSDRITKSKGDDE